MTTRKSGDIVPSGTLMGVNRIDHLGRVVIPDMVRELLGLRTGDQLLFVFEGGNCYIKSLEQFSIEASPHAGLVLIGPDRQTKFDTRRIALLMGISRRALAEIVRTSEEGLDSPTPSTLGHLSWLCRYLIELRALLGSWPRVRRWLHKERPGPQNRSPLELLLRGDRHKLKDFLMPR